MVSKQSGSSILFPVALLVVAALSIQTGAAIAGTLFGEIGPAGMNVFRVGIGAVVLAVLVRPRFWRWSWPQFRDVLAFGIAMAGLNGIFYLALERLPLGVAVAIEFLGPLTLSAVLSRRLLDFIWVGLAATGIGVMGWEAAHSASALDPLGVLFALLAGVSWAAYILAGARVGKSVPGAGGLSGAMMISFLIILPFGLHGVLTGIDSWQLLALSIIAGALAGLIPFSLEYFALSRVPQRVFGVLTSLEPAFATLMGWIILSQDASAWRLGAVALVIAASIGITLGARKVVEVELPGAGEDLSTGPITLPLTAGQYDHNIMGDTDHLHDDGDWYDDSAEGSDTADSEYGNRPDARDGVVDEEAASDDQGTGPNE